MPCFNSEDTIEESIYSVLSQTYQRWELIIYDDASTDDTQSILKHFETIDKRIKVYYNQTNVGPGLNRNRAIENCSGNYIAFLDSDDLWHKDKLLVQLNFMVKGQLDFSHHAYNYFSVNDEGHKSFSDQFFKSERIDKFKYLTKRGFGYCNTFMFSRNVRDRIRFNESVVVAEDFEAFLSFFYEGGYSMGLNLSLGFVRIRAVTRSSDKRKVLRFMCEYYLFRLNGNKVCNCFYLLNYLIDSVNNKRRIDRSLQNY